ncbi:hypothetical protein Syun_011615 [Stephania yunnanensis]|uniref:Phospholipid/glycerol acyltransferase domain-containing protein n=1 Tax=Stephania yunnanensis TaxID=152371 RepID=A0AAP0K035_9MAGN
MFTAIPTFFNDGKGDNYGVVSKLEGTLLLSRSTFPYFMLVAFEGGGPVRALILLLASPFLFLLESLSLESISLKIMIFISMAGLKVTDVKAVAKAVLPRFFLKDLRASAFKKFSCSSRHGKKYVVTLCPRIIVEAFLREYLNVDGVFGAELRIFDGYCTGFVSSPVLMSGFCEAESLTLAIGDDTSINSGFCDASKSPCDSFTSLFQRRFIVAVEDDLSPLQRKDYPRPLIFHDGRLVVKPTPLNCLAILLWIPIGLLIAIFRLLAAKLLPCKLGLVAAAATGMKIRAKFHTCHPRDINNLPFNNNTNKNPCTLYVCSHRTLIDPVMVANVLQRPVTAVTYSLSWVSEMLSPIRTVRLSRDRVKDGEAMRGLLKKGDLVVCPEGTTCREPYLLRFSPLFSEVAEVIVPVAVEAKGSLFYGTSVRGQKGLDSFFFLMNPRPEYHLEFLEKIIVGTQLSASPSIINGDYCKPSSFEIANRVQRLIGDAFGFECTNLTRRDKYRMLAGNDGIDPRMRIHN